jgi:hypothetical protein
MPPLQQQIQVPVEQRDIERQRTLGGAIELCMTLGGVERKQIQTDLRVDKGQFSRWVDGSEGVKWDKLESLQQLCGNAAPALWMYWRSGFDLGSVRMRENELERENRLLREENSALRRALVRTPT